MEILFTFGTTSAAIAAEQALLNGGIAVGVMALPSEIHAGCGICLRVPPASLAQAQAALAAAGLAGYQLYKRQTTGGKSLYSAYDGNA